MIPTKLSICIATLNRGAFIGQTLESIVSQVTDEVEIVIVDGASTDNTPEVVASFAARFPRLNYIRLPQKGGVDRDYDRTVVAAQGEYCWLMSDDDLLKPGALAAVLAVVAQGYSLIVVNAEVRGPDLVEMVEPSRLTLTADRIYPPAAAEQLLADTATYMSFIGSVVIRRDAWLSRERERYFGLEFIHMGVIHQAPLPGAALALAPPWIIIRHGNAAVDDPLLQNLDVQLAGFDLVVRLLQRRSPQRRSAARAVAPSQNPADPESQRLADPAGLRDVAGPAAGPWATTLAGEAAGAHARLPGQPAGADLLPDAPCRSTVRDSRVQRQPVLLEELPAKVVPPIMTDLDQPLISVVIATYKRAGDLDRAIQSVRNEPGDYFEIVVGDDGSPDHTPEIIARHAGDARLCSYRNDVNLGMQENYLKIARFARGRYLFILTDDDFLLPGALAKVKAAIEVHPEAAYLLSDLPTLDERTSQLIDLHRTYPQDTLAPVGLDSMAHIVRSAWVLSRQVLKRDAIDWATWEKFRSNIFFPIIFAGRLILQAPAYYMADRLVMHTWFNVVHWQKFGRSKIDIEFNLAADRFECMAAILHDYERTPAVNANDRGLGVQ